MTNNLRIARKKLILMHLIEGSWVQVHSKYYPDVSPVALAQFARGGYPTRRVRSAMGLSYRDLYAMPVQDLRKALEQREEL